MYVFKLLFDSALLSVVAASTLWNTAGSKWLSPFQILTQTLVKLYFIPQLEFFFMNTGTHSWLSHR